MGATGRGRVSGASEGGESGKAEHQKTRRVFFVSFSTFVRDGASVLRIPVSYGQDTHALPPEEVLAQQDLGGSRAHRRLPLTQDPTQSAPLRGPAPQRRRCAKPLLQPYRASGGPCSPHRHCAQRRHQLLQSSVCLRGHDCPRKDKHDETVYPMATVLRLHLHPAEARVRTICVTGLTTRQA